MTGKNFKGFAVQVREKALLHELGLMRVIDREKAKCVAGFTSTTRANVRLLRLTRAGLLRRFFIATDAKGIKALYTLTTAGAKVGGGLQAGLRRKADTVLVADFFVAHQLHLNEIYCLLKYRPIPIPDVRFVRWVWFREPIDEAGSLVPDAYVELAERERLRSAFVEVDLESEAPSVWRKKVQQYLKYAESQDSTHRFGGSRFRILVVTGSPERLSSLSVHTSQLTNEFFWFTTFEKVRQDGFWSSIWQRPGSETSVPLIEAHQ